MTRNTERARAQLRAALGDNLREAAEVLGVVPSYLSMMVRGQRIPSLPMARRISRQFGIPLDTIADATLGKEAA